MLVPHTPVANLRRAAPPPPLTAQIVFNFMQFYGQFGKIVCWRPAQEGCHPLPRGILDPSLPHEHLIDLTLNSTFLLSTNFSETVYNIIMMPSLFATYQGASLLDINMILHSFPDVSG